MHVFVPLLAAAAAALCAALVEPTAPARTTSYKAFAPASSSASPVALGWNAWHVGNVRTSGSSTYAHEAIIDGGVARCLGAQNGADGGYLALYRAVSSTSSWRLTTRVYLSSFSSAHPTPVISTQIYAPPLFSDTAAFAGIVTDGSGRPALAPPTGYPVPAQYTLNIGRFYTLEVKSTPTASELRVWSDTESRPSTAQATADSLGAIQRVAFLGVDTATFDYEVDSVLVEDLSGEDPVELLVDELGD
jgi:hypothetical protein